MFEKIKNHVWNNTFEYFCVVIVIILSTLIAQARANNQKIVDNLILGIMLLFILVLTIFMYHGFRKLNFIDKEDRILMLKKSANEQYEDFLKNPFTYFFGVLANILKAFGLLLKEINSLFRWDKLRELLLFLITFGITSNLFFPQILDIPIITWKPFEFLHFKQDQKGGIFALFETYKPSDAVQMEIIKSGTLNTIVICVFISAIFFIGGSKLLYSIPRILYEYNKLKNNSSQSK
jgi:hypothetical protein